MAPYDIDKFIKEDDEFVKYHDKEFDIVHKINANWTDRKQIKRRLSDLRNEHLQKACSEFARTLSADLARTLPTRARTCRSVATLLPRARNWSLARWI